jgi:hypothetical protein
MLIRSRPLLAGSALIACFAGLGGAVGVLSVASTPGCAALATLLPTVSEVVSDGVAILGMISSAVSSYFRASPNPTLQAKIEAGIQKAQQALVTGGQLLAGVEGASQKQMATAFADFSAAYGDLMQLIAPLGIVPAQPVTPVASLASDGGAPALAAPSAAPVLVVPTPLALRAARVGR